METKKIVNAIKASSPWYRHNRGAGVLINVVDAGWDEDGVFGNEFFSFSALSIEQLRDIHDRQLARCAYHDSYAGYNGRGESVDYMACINIENEERTIMQWGCIQDERATRREMARKEGMGANYAPSWC